MNEIILLILQSFYLLLPAYFANMAPVIFRKVNFLNLPVDFGYSLNNKKNKAKKKISRNRKKVKLTRDRIFGNHKTWRGLFFATLSGIIIVYFQHLMQGTSIACDKVTSFHLPSLTLFSYDSWLLIGFLLGFGAIFGDLIKSFVKRRLHIDDGKPLYFFDQIDYVVGAYLFLAIYYVVSFEIVIASVVMSFVLTVIVNHASFYLGIRKEKW